MEHTPRLWKVGLFALLSIGALWLMLIPGVVWQAFLSSIILLGISIGEMLALIWRERRDVIYAETAKLEAVAKLDPCALNALGYILPTVRKVWQGLPLQLWADTMATVDQMAHFIETSNSSHTSPERNWNTSQYPRTAWHDIYGWLVRAGFVIPDSAFGNKSFKWYPGKYDELWAIYNEEKRKEYPLENLSPTEDTGIKDDR